jgi:hypothetical protein
LASMAYLTTSLAEACPMPNPQPGGPGCLSKSGLYLLTFPASVALPVVELPPA